MAENEDLRIMGLHFFICVMNTLITCKEIVVHTIKKRVDHALFHQI